MVRPKNLVVVSTEITFNYVVFTELEIDLNHINFGKDQTRASHFSINELAEIVKTMLDGLYLDTESVRNYGLYNCEYFSIVKENDHKRYKMIFCICSDKKFTIGVMTLFRIKKE